MNDIVEEAKPAVMLFLVFSLLFGFVYPLLVTGIVQIAMPEKAGGSFIVVNGTVVGSDLIGQSFSLQGYFHGRPSAVDYAANGSGASNFGPTSGRLMEQARQRVDAIRSENNLSSGEAVPADLVLSSASGLDPHISAEGAMLQVGRIARARGLSESEVKVLVYQRIEPPTLGILGQQRVNVLKLNLALDELTPEL